MCVLKIRSLEEFDYKEKTVLLRLDINSPIDPVTKRIKNENRINMSLPTIRYLLEKNARLVMIAHQGDTLDYQNLIPLVEHAEKLSEKLDVKVRYIDDVAGPVAQKAVKELKPGQAVLLGNLRYLTEEVSTFEKAVKLDATEMLNTYLVRNLAPLMDYYINDAFAAAHRNAPSMVAFQELLPSAGGFLLIKELEALNKVMNNPERPSVFVLGGAKISDAFGMMKQVLSTGKADRILTCGVTANVFLIAKGYDLGEKVDKFLSDRGLKEFIGPAREYLRYYPENIVMPVDLAYEKNNARTEISIEDLPSQEAFLDIGTQTIELYSKIIEEAGTIFVNGPAGVYEDVLFEKGTRKVWQAIADSAGYSVIGGGDSVSAAQSLIDTSKLDYICTAGGAMVRYLSGNTLPLLKAMEKAFIKWDGENAPVESQARY